MLLCYNVYMMITPKEIVKARRRSIALIVNGKGELIVRAPYYAPHSAIMDFVAQKQDWIKKQLALIEVEKETCIPITLEEGERFVILGKEYCVARSEVKEISALGDALLVPQSATKEDLKKYLQKIFLPKVAQRVEFFANYMGVQPISVRLSSAKSKWGSCSYKNALNFSWRLVFCPPETVDYIVVHELSHIENKSHDRKFWQQVEDVLPYYKVQEKWLKTHRKVMEML